MTLLQLSLITSAFIVVFSLSLKRTGLPMIVLAGFVLRAALAVLDNQRVDLPWSGADSARFYGQLLRFTNAPALAAFFEFPVSKSAMYPWINSWIARLAGTEYLELLEQVVRLMYEKVKPLPR
jgi:hypothetical protein